MVYTYTAYIDIVTSFQEFRNRIRRSSENEGLFDEVLKKSLVYSQKYGGTNSGKVGGQGTGRGLESTYRPSLSPDKRNNSSAKSDQLSVGRGHCKGEIDTFPFLDYPHRPL